MAGKRIDITGDGREAGGGLLRIAANFFRSNRSKNGQEQFASAYAENLSHRMPLIYCVVLFNSAMLISGYRNSAPAWLLYWLPLPLIFLTAWRAWYWMPGSLEKRSQEKVKRDLRLLPLLGGCISLAFTAWILALYKLGNEAQQSLVHYIVAVTCFGGILSLGQSPRTAINMAVTVMVPASIVFLNHAHPNKVEVVATQCAVTIILLMITTGHHADFAKMVETRGALEKQKREIEVLADAHRIRSIRDSLTRANNRRRILDLLSETLHDTSTPAPWLALVDLDGFKHINDTFGHASGDAVLIAVTDRIREMPGITEFGRMGGDEFALILPGEEPYERVEETMEQLVQALCRPIIVGELPLSIKASIGVYRCTAGTTSDCLERADSALYKAKEFRDGRIVQFTASDEIALRQRHEMRRIFTSSDLSSQLGLVYQPIVDADTGRPTSYETLARWTPDGERWLSPTSFISLAETTGRIGELTRLVVAKALKEFQAWQWDCNLAVNLSARDILLPDTVEWIASAATRAGAPLDRIMLEITETALITDYQRASANLARLRAYGFKIALDDFGTGQSSLSHVHNLPLDRLKIDQSFARDLACSEKARAIVSTILALARQLHLECTIEGIETAEQQAVARGLGVRIMQGYHFGRPARAEDIDKSRQAG